MDKLNRRDFLKFSGMIGSAWLLGTDGGIVMAKDKSLVTLVKTTNRKEGVRASLKGPST